MSNKIVKITAEGHEIFKQAPSGKLTFNHYDFYINHDIDEADFWLVYNNLPQTETTFCPPQHIVFAGGEPPAVRSWKKRFLKQFKTVILCDPNLKHRHVIDQCLLQHYISSLTFKQLQTVAAPKKTKCLSIVSSNKSYTKGHQQRLACIDILQQHFGDQLDVFGRGFQPINCKWDALYDYRYHIAIENSCLPNYWTEKIMDPLLAWCHPLYFGAPNIDKVFHPKAFTRIDINQPDSVIQTIETILANDDYYSDSASFIEKERNNLLTSHSFFGRLSSILDTIPIAYGAKEKKKITLYPEDKLPFYLF